MPRVDSRSTDDQCRARLNSINLTTPGWCSGDDGGSGDGVDDVLPRLKCVLELKCALELQHRRAWPGAARVTVHHDDCTRFDTPV